MIKTGSAFLALTLLVAGCGGYNNPTNSAAVRTVGGAGLGAVTADALGGSKTTGALIGAVAGGLSCTSGNCY
ncbi:hypothetical protein [Paracoccus laeviglucosivorans]|uniref:17 kDa surface antigen n=1 Tax=Paracoccus laeviglucosivorans TaxID=1197861 RepID=A0A521D2J8_9RHOB|nr:hypothetical protein [Paracoccus laeviglucosivorans]SMO65919.1 hypothetical protein SAMN06265221_10629 [Paracoccus laeviglucosivorans]